MIALPGKVAIVTGAAQGLGAAIARGLGEAGANVIIADCNEPQSPGPNATFQRTDLASDADIDGCVAAARDRFGRLEILVNCAVTYADRGLESTRAEWHRALDVNLIGAALMTARAAAVMTSPGGVVINIGSVGGKFGAAGRALYPAAKAALLQFTRNAAVSLAPRGIRVVSVSPAWTWSPALQRMAGTEARADAVGARRASRRARRPRRGCRQRRAVRLLRPRRLHHRGRYSGRWRLQRTRAGCGPLAARLVRRNSLIRHVIAPRAATGQRHSTRPPRTPTYQS